MGVPKAVAANNEWTRYEWDLDDEMLHDIGLDRRTLQTFCENGCTHTPAPPHRPDAPRAAMMPGPLGAALR